MLNLNRLVCALLLIATLVSSPLWAQALRDPTTPLAGAVTGGNTEAPQLQSILIRSKDKLAIISGETVREGDSLSAFADAVVERIDADHVVIRRGGKRETLRVYNNVRMSQP